METEKRQGRRQTEKGTETKTYMDIHRWRERYIRDKDRQRNKER